MAKVMSRRDFLTAGAAGLLLARIAGAATPAWAKGLLVYVGTYTSGTKSDGIYVLHLDQDNGNVRFRHVIRDVADPSFLAIDKGRKYLFAVNEGSSGSVTSFEINQDDGGLTQVSRQPSLGGAPCHTTVSDNGKFVLVANYTGGNIAVLPVLKNGNLGASVSEMKHEGSGPNKDRQAAPHAHSITLDRKNKFAIAADLGADKLFIYEFDPATGRLSPNAAQPFFQAKAGSGPRHFEFHQNGRFAFVINELDSTLTSLDYDERVGTMKEINTVSTLPADFKGANTCADVHVSPNGRFVYGSNRGHDSIAVFAIDQVTGRIELKGNVPTEGAKPRNFGIDPSGKFLLAANQASGNIVIFRIDQATGMIQPTGSIVDVPAPVCLKFISAFS